MKSLLISIVKPSGAWARWLVFLTLVGLVAAGVTGHFEILKTYLDIDPLTFQIGSVRVSLYTALRALVLLAIIFWTTAIIVDLVDHRIEKLTRMRSSTRVLLTKIVQIAIYVIAGLIALDMIGLDLTTLTVFGGAIGIGVGFGLQKIASNFISGLILLLERSVEQDDLIELPDGTSGFVRRSSARYTLVETFDGREVLIPNEDFITNRVTNWTLTSSKARIQFQVGVAYGSDLELAHRLILEAVREHPRTLTDPEPTCFLLNFGDSSIDFTTLFWVGDVVAGRWGPQSDVMFAIWRKFREHGIEIPFPQRDIHIKTPVAATLTDDTAPEPGTREAIDG